MWTPDEQTRNLIEELTEKYGWKVWLVAYSYSLADISHAGIFDEYFAGTQITTDVLTDFEVAPLSAAGFWWWTDLKTRYQALPHILLELGFVEPAAKVSEMNRWIDERVRD